MQLKEKTAIITGSSGQLGSAIAMALARAGCNCICHYNRDRQGVEKLIEQIKKLGPNASAVAADLSVPEQIEAFFGKCDQFGTPQILINSAALFSRQPLDEVTFEDAQRVLNLNLIAPILISSAFAKKIKTEFADSKSVVGKIINLSDVGVILPGPQ